MSVQHRCPLCGSILLTQARSGKLYWFCRHCHQEIPFSDASPHCATPNHFSLNGNSPHTTTVSSPVLVDHPFLESISEIPTAPRSPLFPASLVLFPPLRDLLRSAIASIQQALSVDRAIVAKVTAEREIAVIEESRKCGSKTMQNVHLGPFLGSDELHSFMRGHIQVINDINQENYREDPMAAMDNLFDVKAKMVAPIWHYSLPDGANYSIVAERSRQLWGLLIVHQCERTRQWEPAEMGLLSFFALQLGTLIQQSELSSQIGDLKRRLSDCAHTDELTQLGNRHHFDRYLSQEWRRLARQKRPLSLIFFSLEGFHFYTHRFGSAAGDACIKQIAREIASFARRPGDLVARYADKTFAAILPDTHAAGAAYVADRVSSHIANLAIEVAPDEGYPYLTVSTGVATVVPEPRQAAAQLVADADSALSQARARGRDRAIGELTAIRTQILATEKMDAEAIDSGAIDPTKEPSLHKIYSQKITQAG